MTVARPFDPSSSAHRLLVCGCVVSFAGCSLPQEPRHAAQALRRAVEQKAANHAAASAAHDVRIFDDETRLPPGTPSFGLGERYYVRPDPRGWSVIDRRTRGSALVGNKAQAGLTYEEATTAAASLQAADHAQWR